MMKTIRVKGISSIGTEREIRYSVSADSDFEAIAEALRYANNEYTCKYDENLNPIPNTVYKEFAEITSIEVINE